MQAAHALGGFDVDGVLCLDLLHLVAGDKAKQLDVFVQVFERELNRFAVFALGGQAVHAKARKVADDDELRQVALGQAGKVIQRLLKGTVQGFAARLVLHQQTAGPEQVHKALRRAQLFDVQLEGGDTFVGDAEDFKKINPERFGLRVFVGSVSPGAAEGEGTGFDFVPGYGHGRWGWVDL